MRGLLWNLGLLCLLLLAELFVTLLWRLLLRGLIVGICLPGPCV
ncbi:putative membrane protein [Mycobacteroides abscessus MAB_082312_2258]|nr:putative membrane protein [Mycobacteroides abscessus MAB_082312_2258]